jgi:hypothetical protein
MMSSAIRALRVCTLYLPISCAGCAYDIANRYYISDKLPPKPVESVEVLNTAPNRPFEVIADFQARRDTVNGMRERAAAVGADAVLVTQYGGWYTSREEWAGNDRYFDSGSRITATAIRYKNTK